MSRSFERIILGGGASGLMTASLLAETSDTLILEAHPDIGAKLAVSGGGRCNLTNARLSPEDYCPGGAFVREVLSRFDQHDTLRWFGEKGLHPVRQKAHQYFSPQSSREVLSLFETAIGDTSVETSTRVREVSQNGGEFHLMTSRGLYRTAQLIVASGGLSYPRLGASDIGYRIAERFGHTIVRPRPALVGLTLQKDQFFLKALSGVATKVVITVGGHWAEGRLLFAHKGITGPAVLDASLYWQKGDISIDFLPGYDLRRLRNSARQIATALPMPKRLAKALLADRGIPDQACRDLDEASWRQLEGLHAYRFAPAGTFGYSKAEVTCGGVATDEIDPVTMESRLCPGLYFVGEVLDVTGRLGGYNLQWAFSSAAACARALAKKKQVL